MLSNPFQSKSLFVRLITYAIVLLIIIMAIDINFSIGPKNIGRYYLITLIVGWAIIIYYYVKNKITNFTSPLYKIFYIVFTLLFVIGIIGFIIYVADNLLDKYSITLK